MRSQKKEMMLLYSLLWVLAAAVVISLVALPKFSRADELEEETEAEKDSYAQIFADTELAAGLMADIDDMEQAVAEKSGSYAQDITAAQADEMISPVFTKNGFEITSLAISKPLTYEEMFPDSKTKSGESCGITVLKLTYEIEGRWEGLSSAVTEIAKLDGCVVGELSCVMQGAEGNVSGSIKGSAEVYVYIY